MQSTSIVSRARGDFRGSFPTRLAVLVVVASLGGAVASLSPALVGIAVDAVTQRKGSTGPPPTTGVLGAIGPWLTASLPAAFGAALVGTLLAVCLTMLAMYLSSDLGARSAAALRTAMLRKALGASADDREGLTRKPGSAKAGPRAASGNDLIRLAIASNAPTVAEFLVSLAASLPQVVFGLAILCIDLITSGAWVALFGGLSLFVLSRLFSGGAHKRVAAAHASMQEVDAALFGRLGETIARSEDLRLLGARGVAVDEFSRAAQACSEARTRLAGALAIAGQVRSAFTALSPLLIVIALDALSRQRGVSPAPGEIAKLLMLVPLLMVRLDGAYGIRQSIQERQPLLESTARILALPSSPVRRERARRVDVAALKGDLRFHGVSFAHPGGGAPLLDDVELEIPAGAVVGICGKSGSGKSTLLRLLLRGIEQGSGRITIDDTDIRDIDPEQLPQVFAVLSQHSGLWERTIRENLALGLDAPPDDAALHEAIELAGLGEQFGANGVRGMAYEYRAGQENLSGGEIRRLLLARMLLRGARVLVLDEPEAALPGADAEALLRHVTKAANGRTTVVVTHAPHVLGSTFNVVVDQGRIIAKGTHAELVESCSVYRELLADALKRGTAPAKNAVG